MKYGRENIIDYETCAANSLLDVIVNRKDDDFRILGEDFFTKGSIRWLNCYDIEKLNIRDLHILNKISVKGVWIVVDNYYTRVSYIVDTDNYDRLISLLESRGLL